jgi:hypothetical protein
MAAAPHDSYASLFDGTFLHRNIPYATISAALGPGAADHDKLMGCLVDLEEHTPVVIQSHVLHHPPGVPDGSRQPGAPRWPGVCHWQQHPPQAYAHTIA